MIGKQRKMEITYRACFMPVMQGGAINGAKVRLSIMVVMKLNRGWEKKQPQQEKREYIFLTNFQWYNIRFLIL
jgi:hypothetical protein